MRVIPAFYALAALLFFATSVMTLRGFHVITQNQVAEVSATNGTLLRLPIQRYLWDRVSLGSALSSDDTIATGEDVYAKIRFHDGSELEIDPGSTIRLKRDQEKILLDFIRGTGMSQFASQSVIIQSKNALRTTAVDRSRWLGHDPISAFTKKPRAAFEAQGQTITTRTLPAVPVLVFPEDQTTLDLSSRAVQPELRWSLPLGASQNYRYEILLRPINSQNPAQIYLTNRLSFRLSNLALGDYIWSVRSIGPNGIKGPLSEKRQVRVISSVMPSVPEAPAEVFSASEPPPPVSPPSKPKKIKPAPPKKVLRKPNVYSPKIRYGQ